MKSQRERMLAGEDYDPLDAELTRLRRRCRDLLHRLNHSTEDATGERRRVIAELLGQDTDAWIEPPFHCDYGGNIQLGSRVYFNFNCVVLDVAPVVIGDHVLFGPGVHIYAATHPLDAAARRSGIESGKPVTIGSDVWVGGGAIICPGVTIGDGAVIGAGSVVTKSIPGHVLAAGNPCRVIRVIPQ